MYMYIQTECMFSSMGVCNSFVCSMGIILSFLVRVVSRLGKIVNKDRVRSTGMRKYFEKVPKEYKCTCIHVHVHV